MQYTRTHPKNKTALVNGYYWHLLALILRM